MHACCQNVRPFKGSMGTGEEQSLSHPRHTIPVLPFNQGQVASESSESRNLGFLLLPDGHLEATKSTDIVRVLDVWFQ